MKSRGSKTAIAPAAIIVLTFALVGCGGANTIEESDGGAAPSVLLITVDTLRADFVGAYGADVFTPTMDALADSGVRFSEARTHIPITGPSHSSIFTSLLPMEHGVFNNGQVLSERFPTIAESMRNGGRSTAAAISLGVMQAKWGFNQGFDYFGGSLDDDWMKDATGVTDEILAVTQDPSFGPYFLWAHYSDPHDPYTPPGFDYPEIELRLNGNVLGVVGTRGRGKRFPLELPPGVTDLEFSTHETFRDRVFEFTRIVLLDPVVEFEPGDSWEPGGAWKEATSHQSGMPATLRLINPTGKPIESALVLACNEVLTKKETRRRYALEVEYADREIGRLLDVLETRGLMSDTLVVLASDHGEGLGDHGIIGHISQLYDTLLRVPLIFSWPGELPPGLVIDDPVGLVDVFPTVAELVGADPPAAASGVSLVPAIRGGVREGVKSFVAATYQPQSPFNMRGILVDDLKYIHTWSGGHHREELYNVAGDASELDDLAGGRPEDLARLRSLLEQRLAEVGESAPIQAELSEEEVAQLRALGYLK